MKINNIYFATIKKCNNIVFYEQYGEERYRKEYRINGMTVGSIQKFAEVIEPRAILIEIGNNKFYTLEQLKTFKDRLLANIRLRDDYISTEPCHNNDHFVDKTTLSPYFLLGSGNNKISYQQLVNHIETAKVTK